MKKQTICSGFVITVFTALVMFALGGCSSSHESDKYVVYKTESALTNLEDNVNDVMQYYQVVFYKERESEDIEIWQHQNDVLTGLVDEIHLQKSAYTEDEVNELSNSIYENIDSISCGSKTITDEGDYYCLMYKFKDLNSPANARELSDAGVLSSTDDEDEDANLISAGSIMRSIKFTLGTTELSEDEVASLDLHFNQ